MKSFRVWRSFSAAWCARFLALILLALLAHGFVVPLPAPADWKADIGYTALQAELGAGMPTGAGISVSMVEADADGNPSNGDFIYLPNPALSQFSGKTIIDGSNQPSSNYSGHANTVGNFFFGNTSSIAGGVTNITAYEANHYLNYVLGYAGSANPVAQTFKVQNHSWIGNLDPAIATNLLQRLDYVIDTQDMTVTVAVNNGIGSVPQLLPHAHNAIAVGRTDGNHSYGLTTIYGAGRVKPDIVAPGKNNPADPAYTSYAAPMVAGAAALLHEVGASTPNATRSEVIKAVLLAGATKNEFPTWDRTTTRPLDDRFGAGELNIYNSYYILTGGETNGSTTQPAAPVTANGWDYGTVTSGSPLYYTFQVPALTLAEELSIILAWNIQVTDTNANPFVFSPASSLANLDLRFYDSTNSFLGTLVDSSLSTVDNVEHIYLTNLGEGTYTLAVSTDATRDFGLAWRTTFVAVPEPGTIVLAGIGGLLLLAVVIRRRRA